MERTATIVAITGILSFVAVASLAALHVATIWADVVNSIASAV